MFFDPSAAASDLETKWVEDHWQKIPSTVLPDGKIRTGPVRLSFPWLFKAQPPQEAGKEAKFSATLLFPAGADLSLLKQAASDKARERWPDAGTPEGPTLHSPFRNQVDKKQFDGYVPGSTFITATALQKPVVVDVRGAPVTDESKLYPGCWVLGIVNPFHFPKNEKGALKKGVSFGLEGIIFIADDRKLGGSGGVNVQAATAGLNIDQSVNVAALF